MYRVFNSWFIFCTAFSWLIPGVVYTNRSTGTGWSDILNAFKNNRDPVQPKPSNAQHLGKSHPCTRYSSWNRVNPIWDNMLLKQNMVVCRKNYGADGNCLFNAVSGILRDHKVSRDTLQLKLTNLPAAVSLSLDDMQFQDTYYTVGDLRRIIAVRFIGVDPHNENALPFWDVSELVGKLEVLSNVEGTQDFGDIRWGPTKILREIRQNGDLLDIAKRLYAMLSQVQNPYSWGSYEDIDTMADIFNMDIYLFFSDQTKIQRFVGSRPDNEQRPVLLLYYHVMTHFDAAGIIQNATSNKGQPIRSMFSIDGCPKLIRQLAAQ
ncbi:OTU-like cysteine protease family protein [Babesia bovis T2Bo]|nr:OTU-like cysteine protease family protein [Babesia bovis T2Bo]EDO08293.2 OTU-like cysteine protease family protein [Babesia bovis T2Bo]